MSPAQRGRVRILATSDLHMQMRSFDYFSDQPNHKAGMTRLATLMRETRAQAEDQGDLVIALDNGDSLQGAPLEVEALRGGSEPHIFYQALALMQYDAAGLGNHDFNFDLEHLTRSVAQSPVPILCTNARRIDGEVLPVLPWTVLERTLLDHTLKIGVFSVLPPQTLVWDADHLKGRLEIDDITDAAQGAIRQLSLQGCDVIIALAHTGLGEKSQHIGQENAIWPLTQLTGLDAIIAGHTHLQLPDPTAPTGSPTARGILNGVPVVMPGSGGAHLGVIDLELNKTENGWRIMGREPRLMEVKSPEDTALSALTEPLHLSTRTHLSRATGQTPIPLHSYFGFLAPSPALAVVAAAKRHALRQCNGVPDNIPVLSTVSPAKMGGRGGPDNYVDIPAGQLCLRHVYDLCFFPNRLAAVKVSGQQLVDWMEMSAGIYARIHPGRARQVLLDPARPAHGSDLFYGLSYTLDLSQPARFDAQGAVINPSARRVATVQYQGRDISPKDQFLVALSSYRANGGGHVTALKDAQRLDIPQVLVRDAVSLYLDAGLFPTTPYENTFNFASLQDTEVIFKTGPGAVAHLNDVPQSGKRTLGLDAQGFLQLGIRL